MIKIFSAVSNRSYNKLSDAQKAKTLIDPPAIENKKDKQAKETELTPDLKFRKETAEKLDKEGDACLPAELPKIEHYLANKIIRNVDAAGNKKFRSKYQDCLELEKKHGLKPTT